VHGEILTEFAAVLLVAAALGAIAVLLRQPLIIAFIVVGVLVGPTGADVISQSDAWDLLSVTGISMLLFVVGLRLETSMRSAQPGRWRLSRASGRCSSPRRSALASPGFSGSM